jgi:glycosyltransferase involved in cell wall biosynthesis
MITTNTLSVGGAERQRVHLANGLSRRGAQVTVAFLQETGPMAENLDPSVRLVHAPVASALGRPYKTDILLTGVTRTELIFGAVLRGKRNTRQWVAASHHAFPYKPSDPYVPYAPDLKALLHLPNIVVGLTRGHCLHLSTTTLTRKTTMIANGVFVDSRKAHPRRTHQATRLVFMGRLVTQKGLAQLLGAWNQVQPLNTELLIYGSGPLRADLTEQAATCPGISFQGLAESPESALRHADWLVLPSLWEAAPMTVLEALSLDVPVLAARVGGVPEMLAEQPESRTVRSGIDSWADLLRVTAGVRSHSSAKRVELVKARNSMSNMIDSHIALFESLLM